MAEEQVLADGLTAIDWLTAGGVFVAGIAVGKVVRMLLTRHVDDVDSEPAATLVVGRLAGSVAVLAGLVYALALLGVKLGPLLGAIGIGGIAVALAAQSFLASFLASVLLQVRRPFRRGDQVMVRDFEGRIEDVNFRAVVLRSYDGDRVFISCSEVINSPIVNYTSRGARRTTLTVGVGYDTDLVEAQRVMAQAAGGVEGVWERPSPEALVEKFGESSIDFVVRWWHDPDNKATWEVRSRVAVALKAALDRAGMVIAFPQRVLHLATLSGVVDLTDPDGAARRGERADAGRG